MLTITAITPGQRLVLTHSSTPSRNEMNSFFRPPSCTYRLDWARRTSWIWRDKWDDTALQTQDSRFELWRPEVKHANSRSRRLPTILNLYEWAGKKHFEGQIGVRARDIWLPKQAALTTAPRPPSPCQSVLIEEVHVQTQQTWTLTRCCYNVSPDSIMGGICVWSHEVSQEKECVSAFIFNNKL